MWKRPTFQDRFHVEARLLEVRPKGRSAQKQVAPDGSHAANAFAFEDLGVWAWKVEFLLGFFIVMGVSPIAGWLISWKIP